MQIVDIHIPRCERLENWSLEGLDTGLNVICGPNGSGKTTLLRFLSGLLSRSDPPCSHRQSGTEASSGAARVLWQGRYACLSARRRLGHATTRMICSNEDVAFNDELRRCWDRLASVVPATMLLSDLSSREAHTGQLAAALAQCRRLVENLHASPHFLDGPSSPAERDEELLTACTAAEQHLEQSRLHAASARRSQQRRLNESESQLQRLDTRIAELQVQVDLLDGNRQSVVTDLRECEDRIWNATADHAGQSVDLHSPVVDDLERQITTAQQFLRDVLAWRTASTLAELDGSGNSIDVEASHRRVLVACEDGALTQLSWLRDRLASRQKGPAALTSEAAGRPDTRPESLADRIQRLRNRRDHLEEQLDRTKRHWRDVRIRRSAQLGEHRRIASRRELDQALYDVQIAEQLCTEATLKLASFRWSQSIVRNRPAGRAVNADQTLADASEWFSRLTDDRYEGLVLIEQVQELAARRPSGELCPLASLSRGTQEQAVLAVKLAVAAALTQCGIHCPVLVDDVLADTDDARMKCALRALTHAARTGMQIIVVTCQRHVSELFQAAGVTVFDMDVHHAAKRCTAIPLDPSGEVDDLGSFLDRQRRERVHSAEPCWLRGDSPVMLVPSATPEIVRQLAACGVFEVRDILQMPHTESCDEQLAAGVSRAQLHQICGEARLLSTVPGLTGRDAQLLVRCGIAQPEELATADVDVVAFQIDRAVHNRAPDVDAVGTTWPARHAIERWISSAAGVVIVGGSRRKSDPETGLSASTRPDSSDNVPSSRSTPHWTLLPDSDVTALSGIGERAARRLKRVGVNTVAQLLASGAADLARRVGHRRVTEARVRGWQRQAELLCHVPDLGTEQARLLVGVGISSINDLRRISASALHASLLLFAQGPGSRMLHDNAVPTRETVEMWIEWAQRPRATRAA